MPALPYPAYYAAVKCFQGNVLFHTIKLSHVLEDHSSSFDHRDYGLRKIEGVYKVLFF